MGYFMSVAECVANGFFLTYFFILIKTNPDKLVTHNIRPFYFLIFVRFADFINCQIVKGLKSPNGANIVSAALTEVVLIAIAETLVPRDADAVLRRTPIVGIRKTTNHCFL